MNITKILMAAAALSVSTAAVAGPYDYQGRYVYHNYDRGYDRDYRRYERHDHDRWVVSAIAGLVLGAVISSANHQERRDVPVDQDRVYRQPAPRTYVYDPRCDCYR